MEMLRLSQGQLSLLETCPRKFQHIYLEQLAAPPSPEQQERLNQGSRFHLLIQQWHLGLPVEPLLKEDSQLQQWFQALVAAEHEILKLEGDVAIFQESEQGRSLEFQGYLLTVVYDFLLLGNGQARILDWKTYPRPQKPEWLLHNWQTRLYPFALAETSRYKPEQISMIYWFFQSGGKASEPQSLRLTYNFQQDEQTRQTLSHLLSQLTQWLEHYKSGEPFPQLPLGARNCETCSFALRCGRNENRATSRSTHLTAFWNPDSKTAQNQSQGHQTPSDRVSNLPNLADIQEIPL